MPAFLEALKVDAAGSREEEGCLRFDLLKDSENANTWHFYEIYKDNDAMAVHKTLPHYKAWADFKARFAASFRLPSRLCCSSPRRGLARAEPAVEATAARHRRDQPNAGRRRRRVAEGGQVHGRRLHGLSCALSLPRASFPRGGWCVWGAFLEFSLRAILLHAPLRRRKG